MSLNTSLYTLLRWYPVGFLTEVFIVQLLILAARRRGKSRPETHAPAAEVQDER